MPCRQVDSGQVTLAWREAFGCEPSLPMHVLVAPDSRRVRSRSLVTHVMPHRRGGCRVVRLCDGLSVVIPEELCLQLAPSLTKIELLMLVEELMGTYAIRPDLQGGMLQRKMPLMTPSSLRAHLDESVGASGVEKAAWVLDRALPASASPRESKLALRLSLKPALGGYGLSVLALNGEVRVSSMDVVSIQTRKPDVLVFNPAKGAAGPLVALEYDGAGHLEEGRRSRDIRRANELAAAGYSEYVLDKSLYASQQYMDSLVLQVRHDLGLPRLRLSREQAQTRLRRRERLFEELEAINGVTWDGKRREAECARIGAGQPPIDDVVPLEAYGL